MDERRVRHAGGGRWGVGPTSSSEVGNARPSDPHVRREQGGAPGRTRNLDPQSHELALMPGGTREARVGHAAAAHDTDCSDRIGRTACRMFPSHVDFGVGWLRCDRMHLLGFSFGHSQALLREEGNYVLHVLLHRCQIDNSR